MKPQTQKKIILVLKRMAIDIGLLQKMVYEGNGKGNINLNNCYYTTSNYIKFIEELECCLSCNKHCEEE